MKFVWFLYGFRGVFFCIFGIGGLRIFCLLFLNIWSMGIVRVLDMEGERLGRRFVGGCLNFVWFVVGLRFRIFRFCGRLEFLFRFCFVLFLVLLLLFVLIFLKFNDFLDILIPIISIICNLLIVT